MDHEERQKVKLFTQLPRTFGQRQFVAEMFGEDGGALKRPDLGQDGPVAGLERREDVLKDPLEAVGNVVQLSESEKRKFDFSRHLCEVDSHYLHWTRDATFV